MTNLKETILKEFEEKFHSLCIHHYTGLGIYTCTTCSEDVKSFLTEALKRVSESEADKWEKTCAWYYEEGRKKTIEEIREKVERLKLEVDTVVCDCGRPYKESDLADLIYDFLKTLSEN